MTTTSSSALSDAERKTAQARYQILQPFLNGESSLAAVMAELQVTERTVWRWIARYRQAGLAGLVRKPRNDQGQRHLHPQLLELVEGLVLQHPNPNLAAIYRRVCEIAKQQGWHAPSYDTVYAIAGSLDPALVTLAHAGEKSYRDSYELVHRHQANRPNEIWQADHTLLDLYLLRADGDPARPWLTVIEDDYSRCIAGYFLSFDAPNSLNTALALRQAIWRKTDPRWRICGIPSLFYTDHGSDFTSEHLEQVAIDLKMQLVFSSVGIPRGRGKIERFFGTVNQCLLCDLPGYTQAGDLHSAPALTLNAFEARFLRFLLAEYHLRLSQDRTLPPQEMWEADSFIPQMPESLEALDLLLLRVAKTRHIQRDGIHFQKLRYIDPTLAAYVGEEVVIRYDPRDMAEIRVYFKNAFLCRAICTELADQTVTLKAIVDARNQRRRVLRQRIREGRIAVETYLEVHCPPSDLPIAPADDADSHPSKSTQSLKLYRNE